MFKKWQLLKTTLWIVEIIDNEILNNIIIKRGFTPEEIKDLIQKNSLKLIS
jgi:hypothetical protein